MLSIQSKSGMRTSLEAVLYTLLCLIDTFALTTRDTTTTGVETISHIRENGRITVMLCAFEGPPRIVRLFGIGTCLDQARDVPGS